MEKKLFAAATLKPESHRKDSEGEAEDRGFAQSFSEQPMIAKLWAFLGIYNVILLVAVN